MYRIFLFIDLFYFLITGFKSVLSYRFHTAHNNNILAMQISVRLQEPLFYTKVQFLFIPTINYVQYDFSRYYLSPKYIILLSHKLF